MVLLDIAVSGSKKLRFIKDPEANGFYSSLKIRQGLDKIPLVGPTLFEEYKMNEILNKFLLAEAKLMPEMYLRQPGFTFSAYGSFNKNKERIEKFK